MVLLARKVDSLHLRHSFEESELREYPGITGSPPSRSEADAVVKRRAR